MQLIIITHDEEFVNVMKQSLSMQVGIVVVEFKLSFRSSLPYSFVIFFRNFVSLINAKSYYGIICRLMLQCQRNIG